MRVVPHDPGWQHAFNIEAAGIAQALGEPAVTIHHIGSTAIPGIVAKPVIDILLEVERIERLDQQVAALQRLGYEAAGEYGIPGRRYFRKSDQSGRRTHHVHGFLAGSDGVLAGSLLSAQSADPWIGTWTRNLAKSKFTPGPPLKSNTLKIEAVAGGK